MLYLTSHWFLNILFIYSFLFFGCAGSSVVYGIVSSYGQQGLLFMMVHRLFIAVAPLASEQGL